MNIALQK